MAGRSCRGCGAVLRDRPAASSICPLCGYEMVAREKAPPEAVDGEPQDSEAYRSNVRALRDELARLRRGEAEAV